jgi:hypothetical protein
VGNPRAIPALRISGYALAGDPAALTLEGGQGQRGRAGKPLAKSVVVTVRDRQGNPVAGVTVLPVPDKHNGSADSVVTDLRGRAALRWTLGTTAGAQSLRLRIAEVDSGLSVHASAGPAEPASITIRELAGKKPAGVAEQRLQANVLDAYGNAVGGVALAITASSGRLAASRVRSDDSGRAAISWTPARSVAEQRLTVRVVGGSVQATHTGRPNPSAPVAAAPAKRRG